MTKLMPRESIYLAVALVVIAAVACHADDSYTKRILPLVDKYCVDCHDAAGGIKPKGGVDLFKFESADDVLAERAVWKKVLNAVRLHEMPPARKRAQPSDAERRIIVDWVTKALAKPSLGQHVDPGQPVMRRLTRLEYNNTVRDLLGLETDVFMFSERLPFNTDEYYRPQDGKLPDRLRVTVREYGSKYPVLLRQAGLPGDSKADHGFTNRGDVLNVSPLLLEKYVALAHEIMSHPDILTRADRLQEIFPNARFRAPTTRVAHRNEPRKPQIVTVTGKLATQNNVARTAKGSAYSLEAFRKRVAEAFAQDRGGVYDVSENSNTTIAGKGGLLQLSYGKNANRIIGVNPNEDLWNAAFATAVESSGDSLFTNRQKLQKKFFLQFQSVLHSRGVAEVGVVVLSRRGQSGKVRVGVEYYGNTGEGNVIEIDLAEGAGKDNTFVSFAAPDGVHIRNLTIDGSGFSGDYVLLDDLAFITRDPVPDGNAVVGRETPVVSGRELPKNADEPQPVSDTRPAIDKTIARRPPRERLAHFMSRAFRRPAKPAQVDLYLGIYNKATSSGANDESAMKAALRAVLCSPQFLFRVETPVANGRAGPTAGVRRLNDFELASRLSYFLWASMPDDELFKAAQSGQLRDEKELETQVRRMLRHRRSAELAESFAFQWLRLNELFGSKPDRGRFREFYGGTQSKYNKGGEMIAETLLLFETILAENRSIMELIDADYAYLNATLIRHYGMADHFSRELASLRRVDRRTGRSVEDNSQWVRVRLPDRRRGGVFTSGGVLTLTSLPLRTSPVYRGTWMAEAIFNRPPPPPPAMVEELGDDDEAFQEAGLTLRQKLEQHRSKPSCAGCHARIDPLGFALENFDPIGRWRTDYAKLPVDAKGELFGGRKYDGPVEFKDAILKRKNDFARAFTEHLLSYALGRKLEFFDVATVDAIVAKLEADGYRFETLIIEIVKSYPFRNTRN